jgi:hypothetical protein
MGVARCHPNSRLSPIAAADVDIFLNPSARVYGNISAERSVKRCENDNCWFSHGVLTPLLAEAMVIHTSNADRQPCDLPFFSMG